MGDASDFSLCAGKLRLTLSPSIGGSISAFEWTDGDGRRPILRECHSPLRNVLDACSFPLVPYVNRIRGGRFAFRGREISLAPNMPGDASPLHGQGWLNPWSVEESNAVEARLHFRHGAGEWPWDYEARQVFALDERGLSLTLDCRNLADEPMPCGLGQHPYFPCGLDTRLDTDVTDVWTIDEKVLPVEKVRATGRYDLLARLTVDRLHEPYRASIYPQLPRMVEAARGAGALGACLSGAGSTILAFTDSMAGITRIEAAFFAAAADVDLPGRVQVVAPRNAGARVVSRT